MDFSNLSPGVILFVVVFLALAPFLAVMVTSFTKIVVVLSLLRNALGLQQVPPNVVINGLALVLSIYVMNPVLQDVCAKTGSTWCAGPGGLTGAGAPASTPAAPGASTTEAAQEAGSAVASDPNSRLFGDVSVGGARAATPPPRTAGATGGSNRMNAEQLLQMVNAGREPLRKFLIQHSHDAERGFFLRSAQRLLPPGTRNDLTATDFIVVIPAFTVSELTAAFQIGFLIFLPFLIIDLVVANILLALGMMMLSPTTISLPFKLLLFVMVDGWAKLVHGLVLTYSAAS